MVFFGTNFKEVRDFNNLATHCLKGNFQAALALRREVSKSLREDMSLSN
jgi:hypothetical protein